MSKTEHPMMDDMALEALFEASRTEAPLPSEALLARIMADAEAEAAARERPAQSPVRPRTGVIAAVLGVLGGWPAVAGMVTATVAGIWVGFAAPDQLNTLAGGLLLTDDSGFAASYELEDIVPGGAGLGTLLEEG
ncbi:hypothetical protein [Sinisalibacter aestuarii]|uniref:Dihydroorotate dehydrogenase n=1 Tax=Sinisalibacter aestuarii TaxID=2949426 RepID=A0ABQ5LV09_9RHOB|nr:hypothetical protein [Sinisalibacter aestuarii]GKY88603.1 hypothetical protein STA1M1_24720 [Sinisalibacter aestuarii]